MVTWLTQRPTSAGLVRGVFAATIFDRPPYTVHWL